MSISSFENADVAREGADNRRLKLSAVVIDPIDGPLTALRFEEPQTQPHESLPEVGAVLVLIAESTGQRIAHAACVEFLPFSRTLQSPDQAAIADLPGSHQEIERMSLLVCLASLMHCEQPLCPYVLSSGERRNEHEPSGNRQRDGKCGRAHERLLVHGDKSLEGSRLDR